MPTIIARQGEAIPLSLILADGVSSKYPRAVIYDRVGSSTPIASIDLIFVADGYYYGSFAIPAASKYNVVYKVYLDAPRTILDPNYGFAQDLIVSDTLDPSVIASMLAEAQLNVSYEDDPQIFRAAAWMDRGGRTVVAPMSCTIRVHDETNATMFTASSTTPYPDGIFFFQQNPLALQDNRLYYVEVTVVDSLGSVTTVQTFTTIG